MSKCIGEGVYGSVKVDPVYKNKCIKTFENTKTFFKELFYLSLFKNQDRFCQIISYNAEKLEIKMRKYDMTLYELSFKLPFHKRIEIVDTIICQLLEGLSQMHAMGIVHYDLHSKNIFCNYNKKTEEVQCYIGDFSVSCVFIDKKNNKNNIREELIDEKYDIWYLGLTMYSFLIKNYFDKNVENNGYLNLFELLKDCKNTTRTYLKHFLMVNKSERFGFNRTNPLSTKFSDLYHILKDDLDDNFAYLLSNIVLFYDEIDYTLLDDLFKHTLMTIILYRS